MLPHLQFVPNMPPTSPEIREISAQSLIPTTTDSMAAMTVPTVVKSSLIETSSDRVVLEESFGKERFRDPAVFAVPFSLEGLPVISTDEYVERSQVFALMHEYFFTTEERHRKIL